MTFFDKKEDVLDIKLTPYGRHLLSRGKLMPMYYAFLDDDIIYNVQLQTTSSAGKFGEYNSEIKIIKEVVKPPKPLKDQKEEKIVEKPKLHKT